DGAGKIFVYKFGGDVTEEEILPLHMALNQRSSSTLLWVVPAEPNRPPGAVEVLRPGLLKGYIDRFAPAENAHDLSFAGWLKVCANAVVLASLTRSTPEQRLGDIAPMDDVEPEEHEAEAGA